VDDRLDGELLGRAAERGSRTRQADLVSRALELAVATRTDDRAWGLIRLAADLRALGRYDDALRALDVAWRLSPGERPERAAFTCAIAIHCDRDEHLLAETLERQLVGREIDLELGLACLRLYSELFTLTVADEHRARREFYRATVERLETQRSVAA
jgi:hypothetical protein